MTIWDAPNQQVVREDASGPGDNPVAPTITRLEPESRVVGPTDDVDLHVYGTDFVLGSRIRFADTVEQSTRFVSTDELVLQITGALFTGPDTVEVAVQTGDLESNVLPFTFTPAPEPELQTEPEEPDG